MAPKQTSYDIANWRDMRYEIYCSYKFQNFPKMDTDILTSFELACF